MPVCFSFKNKLNSPNLIGKTYMFTSPKTWLFFFKQIYFYFLSLVGIPMNNCAKYQHPNKKIVFFEKSQIAFSTISNISPPATDSHHPL